VTSIRTYSPSHYYNILDEKLRRGIIASDIGYPSILSYSREIVATVTPLYEDSLNASHILAEDLEILEEQHKSFINLVERGM
jgi:hypothetical protein